MKKESSLFMKKMTDLFSWLRDLTSKLPQADHQRTYSDNINFLESLFGSLLSEIEKKHRSFEEFQEYHHMILGSVTDMIFILDKDQTITYTNPAVFNNLGFLGPEINAQSIDSLLFESGLSHLIKDEMFYGPEEHLFTSKKGDKIPCLVHSNAIFLNQSPYGHVCIVQNIKEKKREEELLNQQRLQLMEASRLSALGEMSKGVAHELNNPLTILTANIKLFKKSYQNGQWNSEKIDQFFCEMERIVQRIVQITMSLRSATQDGERPKLMPECLEKILFEVHSLLQKKLKESRIEIEFKRTDNGREIPIDNDSETIIICNRMQISQILLNLINNSIEAICNLQEKWIKIKVKNAAEFLEISVMDSGPGIPDHIGHYMFQPFFTTKGNGKGTGIGLTLAKKIMENHQGELYLDSSGPHTKFVFKIPHKIDQS